MVSTNQANMKDQYDQWEKNTRRLRPLSPNVSKNKYHAMKSPATKYKQKAIL